jgi:hypothetical protein
MRGPSEKKIAMSKHGADLQKETEVISIGKGIIETGRHICENVVLARLP